MIRRMYRVLLALAVTLAISGCGGGRPVKETTRPPSPPISTVEMSGSTIAVADPAGRWRLEASSPEVTAEGVDGPFRLEPATCRYQERGRPPVLMRAATAVVDRAASRVTLEGNVSIMYQALTLKSERVEYDLKRGEVVARGRTKLTYPKEGSGDPWPAAGEDGGSR